MSREVVKSTPITEPLRVASIDLLRGVAVLGILVMNIQSFSMVDAAYINPTAYGDLTGPNYWVWAVCHVLADQKFMGIFSMLFGAGIVIMTGRVEAAGGRPARLHYRRMGWLILFGLLHAHLLWTGDILYTYGMCGLFVYPFRKRSSRALFVTALVFLSVGSAISLGIHRYLRSLPPEDLAEFSRENWQPDAAAVAEELATYRADWLAQLRARQKEAVFVEVFLFPAAFLWKAAAMMFFGMGLFKLGVFHAACPARFYRSLIALAVFAGIPIIAYGVRRNFAARWDIRYSFFFGPGSEYNYWGSVLVALGWVAAVMLLYRSAHLQTLRRALGSAGRMAFTNYILQTLICTTIFYGHGLGLFGSVERAGQIGIVFVVWALELALSPIWLRHFRFGPLEWLWRTLTYWQLQPIRRADPGQPPVVGP